MLRSVEETAAGLGDDGPAWKRVFGSSSANFGALLDDMLAPIIHLPRHPFRLVRFGIPAAVPATLLARAWKSPQARALFGGVAAHSFAPLSRPMSSAVGCALIDAGHAFGWPVARGGSGAITDALASVLLEHGGKVETGHLKADTFGQKWTSDGLAIAGINLSGEHTLTPLVKDAWWPVWRK